MASHTVILRDGGSEARTNGPMTGLARLVKDRNAKALHTRLIRQPRSKAMLAPEEIGCVRHGVARTGYTHCAPDKRVEVGLVGDERGMEGSVEEWITTLRNEGSFLVGNDRARKALARLCPERMRRHRNGTITPLRRRSFWIGGNEHGRARHGLQRLGDAGIGDASQGLDTSLPFAGEAFAQAGIGMLRLSQDRLASATPRAVIGAKLYENKP